jgi:hypothetical protein
VPQTPRRPSATPANHPGGMTVELSLYQPGHEAQRIQARERMDRLRAFSPDQMAAGLIWLLGYDQWTFDAVLDAVEPCIGSEDPFGSNTAG